MQEGTAGRRRAATASGTEERPESQASSAETRAATTQPHSAPAGKQRAPGDGQAKEGLPHVPGLGAQAQAEDPEVSRGASLWAATVLTNSCLCSSRQGSEAGEREQNTICKTSGEGRLGPRQRAGSATSPGASGPQHPSTKPQAEGSHASCPLRTQGHSCVLPASSKPQHGEGGETPGCDRPGRVRPPSSWLRHGVQI